MRFLDSQDYRRRKEVRLLHTGPRLTQEESRNIFREMVRGETRNGPLNHRRRKRLIQYAAALELTAVEAGGIVTEVCQEEAQRRGETVDRTPPSFRLATEGSTTSRWPVWLTLVLVVIGLLAVDRIIRLTL
jgi:hypothetical protein